MDWNFNSLIKWLVLYCIIPIAVIIAAAFNLHASIFYLLISILSLIAGQFIVFYFTVKSNIFPSLLEKYKDHSAQYHLSNLQTIIDLNPDKVIIIGTNLRILLANKKAKSAFGTTIIGKELNKVIQVDSLIRTIRLIMGNGESTSIDIISNHDYVERIYSVSIELVGKLLGVENIIYITMRDKTEISKSKEMIKNFITNASHEIRTPLTSIVGFIELLETLKPDEEEKRKTFIKIIADQARHMTNLVNDLLSLSKAELNESTMPTGIVNMEEIIDLSVNNMRWSAQEKNIKIEKIYDNLPEIIGEKSELVQVLTNLIGNAIKYSPNNTKIEIIANADNSSPNKKLLKINIKDYGEGIAAEYIPRLTERFFRVEKLRGQDVSGAGVGLAIVKHILNRHRGWLDVKSKPGKGSEFIVFLPLYEQDQLLD